MVDGVYFDPAETYIWDLKFDDKGSLFVATGNRTCLPITARIQTW